MSQPPTTRKRKLPPVKEADAMRAITIRAYGSVKGQPRHRAVAMNGRARVYDPGTAGEWKACIAEAVLKYLPERPITNEQPIIGPTRVDVTALFARPRRLLTKRSPAGRIRHVVKPDRDNIDKAVLDTLVRLGVLADDKQVCAGEIEKFYVAEGELPGAIIRIEPLEDAT